MPNYELVQREVPRLKAALVRAKKSGDPKKVLSAVERAYAVFEGAGTYPDDWRIWENARDDIRYKLSRGVNISKTFKTLKAAERYQNRLYDEYESVRLVACPFSGDAGVYVWEVRD